MRLHFTKMHGAGNDFVVLDATRAPIELTPEQYRALGDRRFGVGADQILIVENSDTPGVDFRYRIFNNTGDEVEHCGNGARCFVRYVRSKGLTTKDQIRVETMRSGERMATRRSMTPMSTRRFTRRKQVAGDVWTAAASSRLD